MLDRRHYAQVSMKRRRDEYSVDRGLIYCFGRREKRGGARTSTIDTREGSVARGEGGLTTADLSPRPAFFRRVWQLLSAIGNGAVIDAVAHSK